MSKLIITVGLPASGKTTWAKEQVELGKGKVKRVNRDSMREMIDAGKWSKEREKEIVELETKTIRYLLSQDYTVIVDDTNLSEKVKNKWAELAYKCASDFEIVSFLDVDIHECIRRDQKRPNYVGEKVISKMYHQFLSPPTPFEVVQSTLPKAYIFDIDGTLAIHTSRTAFEYEKCGTDSVNMYTKRILDSVYDVLPNYTDHIIIVSGRPGKESIKEKTVMWLEENEIHYDKLYMIDENDSSRDDLVKRKIYEEHIKNKYEVMGVFDDRLRTCRMWHLMGLPVFRVGDPDANF